MDEMRVRSGSISGRVVVVAVTRDHSEVWSLEDGQRTPLAVVLRHDEQAEHRHVRTGQFAHGHTSDEGFVGYFGDLATLIADAEEIMIAGHGKGKANSMEAFAEFLQDKRPTVFAKVSEMRYVDVPHTTGNELAALARKWKREQGMARGGVTTNSAEGASRHARGVFPGRRRRTTP